MMREYTTYNYFGLLLKVYSDSLTLTDKLALYFGNKVDDDLENDSYLTLSINRITDNHLENKAELIVKQFDDKLVILRYPSFSISDGRVGSIVVYATEEEICNHQLLFNEVLRKHLTYLVLRNSNILTIHGAAIKYGKNTALILGESGVGKSTFAYNCLKNEMKYISDDMIIKHLGIKEKIIWGNPYNTYLDISNIREFNKEEFIMNYKGKNGKTYINLAEIYNENLEVCGEVSAVIFLTRSPNTNDYLLEKNSQDVLDYLSPNLDAMKYPDEEEIIEKIKEEAKRFVNGLKVFELQIGNNIDEAIKIVKSKILA